jgi:sugar lactone lactonase YvrE
LDPSQVVCQCYTAGDFVAAAAGAAEWRVEQPVRRDMPMNRKPRSSCFDRTTIARAFAVCCLAAICFPSTGIAEDLFQSKPLTLKDEYTSHIEGPAVNAAGDLFVANIKIPGAGDKGGAIGRMKNGTTTSQLFAILPNNGVGNGIRFDLAGRMYVADFANHIIHVFESGSTTAQPYFSATPNGAQPAFNQPNDLAIARDGTFYASDPKGDGTGRIWKITKDASGKVAGKIMTTVASPPRKQGKTNGLDLSPDNKTLYVSESRFARHGVLKANRSLRVSHRWSEACRRTQAG